MTKRFATPDLAKFACLVMRSLAALTFALTIALPAYALDGKKLVDLTYEFSAETHHWPTAQPFHFEKIAEGRTAAGFWYSSYNYGGSEHVGTHLDAPFHFAEGKWTACQRRERRFTLFP